MSKTEEWGLDVTIDELTILQDLLDREVIRLASMVQTDWYKFNINVLSMKVDDLLDEIGAWDE